MGDKIYRIIKIENNIHSHLHCHLHPSQGFKILVQQQMYKCMYICHMEKKIKIDKKYSNDVTKNICVIFYLHNKKYFKKESSMLTSSCAHHHMFTS